MDIVYDNGHGGTLHAAGFVPSELFPQADYKFRGEPDDKRRICGAGNHSGNEKPEKGFIDEGRKSTGGKNRKLPAGGGEKSLRKAYGKRAGSIPYGNAEDNGKPAGRNSETVAIKPKITANPDKANCLRDTDNRKEKTMKIQLSDHFTYGRLIRFTLPSIFMMIFTSIYGMVDGFFISNYVGKTAFASVNLIIPYLQILGGVGAMLGVGGSALVAKTLGEGNVTQARRYFTMMMYLMLGTSIFFTVFGILALRPVAYLFRADESMIGICMTYGTVCLLFNTALQAQYTFQSYMVVAEKPKLALGVIVLAGCTNMVLDYVFMALLQMGVAGAALATGLSQCVAGVVPFLWFLSKKNTSALRFTRTKFEISPMVKACINGSSEMLTSISASITGILYNYQLMRHAGQDGVAAYGVVMYASFVFIGIYMGYSSGSSPIMGYHYGAGNHKEMKNVMKKSIIMLAIAGVVLSCTAVLLARPIASIFVGYDAALLTMTTRAFRICTIPFLVMWLNMYASSFFTALNDGPVSAAISFLRALVLPVICILILPEIWQLDGVWFALVISEVLSVGVSLAFLLGKRKKYHY